MERLLQRLDESVAPSDPKGYLGTFLERMDVLSNGLRYGIFESEDPGITLAWKKRIDAVGFDPSGWGRRFVMGFLDTLGRKQGFMPEGVYSEDEIGDWDAEWGIDVPAKAARLRSREITRTDYVTTAAATVSDGLVAEAIYLIDLRSRISGENLDDQINILKSINRSRLIGFFMEEIENYASEFDCLRAFLESQDTPIPALTRIGKTAFSHMGDLWFLFDPDVSPDNPVLEALKPEAPLGDFPSPAYTATRLISGEALEFEVDGERYTAIYPLNQTRAYLFRGETLLGSGTIDGFLTKPRFATEDRAKRFSLLKAFKESTEKRVIPVEETGELFDRLISDKETASEAD